MLKRTKLRQHIKHLLLNKTDARHRVYDSLPFPVDAEDCPCILIYTPEDRATSRAKHLAIIEATMTINIEVRCAGQFGETSELLDNIIEQIEDLVLSDETFQSEIEGITSINAQTAHEAIKENTFSIAILSISVDYKRNIEPKPDGHYLFASVEVDAIQPNDPNLGVTGPDGRIEAVLDVVIPQN